MSQSDDTAGPEFLTVHELAQLLRIKERKVYDLVASGEVPCVRVTGRLLFPEAEIRAWIAGSSTGRGVRPAPRPAIFLGSHDPLLEWALRQSCCGLATYLDGSLDGLERFRAGGGVAAGLHLPGPSGEWNVPSVIAAEVDDAALVSWARRRRGLVVREEDAEAVRGLDDLIERCVIPRQAGSGACILFENLLSEAGIPPGDLTFAESARSEGDAISAVAQGAADVAFGLEALAALHRLHFVSLVEERFDMLVDRRAWFEPAMQRLVAFCMRPEFRTHASTLPGYDVSELFEVRWNA